MLTKIILGIILVIVSICALRLLKILFYLIKYKIAEDRLFKYYASREFLDEERKIMDTIDHKIKVALNRSDKITLDERLLLTTKGKKLMGKWTKAEIEKLMAYQSKDNRTELLKRLPSIENKKLANRVLIFISNRTLLSRIIWYLSNK